MALLLLLLLLLSVTATAVSTPADATAIAFVLVSDLDRASRTQNDGRAVWRAWLQHGELRVVGDAAHRRYTVRIGREEELLSQHAYRERGMELSDLVQFGSDLWSVCDSTGLLYRLRGVGDEERSATALPQRVLLDDDGNTSMPCKSEWMAVKDGELYVGGHGKEWVDAGVVRGRGAEWVRVLSSSGSLRYEDWHDRYAKLRAATNTSFPGYMSHEGVDWDEQQRRWVIVPRKAQDASVEGGYDDTTDETRGTNLLLTVSEDFDTINVSTIGDLHLAWGASGIRLLPAASTCPAAGVGARHVLVVRSSENGDGSMSSVGVFSLKDGQSLLTANADGESPQTGGNDVVWVPVGSRKYEGVAWLPLT